MAVVYDKAGSRGSPPFFRVFDAAIAPRGESRGEAIGLTRMIQDKIGFIRVSAGMHDPRCRTAPPDDARKILGLTPRP